MPDALRLNFTAPSTVPVSALLDDLQAMATALGCTELAQLVDDLRPEFASPNATVQRVIPASWMAPWFPSGVVPPAEVGLLLSARDVMSTTNLETPSTLVERQAELVIFAVPTGSFDMSRLVPLIETFAAALGTADVWPRKTEGGSIACHVLPGGWRVLEGVPVHPSHLYGLPGEVPVAPVSLEEFYA